MAKVLGFSRSKIESYLDNAPNAYKVYTIPKRITGVRVIAHPSKELKVYQRALTSILEDTFQPHSAAYAYVRNKSIKMNALLHAKNQYILKMDFYNFFNSITPELLFTIAQDNKINFSQSEKKLLSNILFWNKNKSHEKLLVLSVGAPSSPLISNYVMTKFDNVINEICHEKKIKYSRYADDITFSTKVKDVLFSIPAEVRKILASEYNNKIIINESKTIFSSKAHNRHITGLTISNNGKISLGRERKRFISMLTHKYTLHQLNIEDFIYLRGLMSFAIHIEPEFIDRLYCKYGQDIIHEIVKGTHNE